MAKPPLLPMGAAGWPAPSPTLRERGTRSQKPANGPAFTQPFEESPTLYRCFTVHLSGNRRTRGCTLGDRTTRRGREIERLSRLRLGLNCLHQPKGLRYSGGRCAAVSCAKTCGYNRSSAKPGAGPPYLHSPCGDYGNANTVVVRQPAGPEACPRATPQRFVHPATTPQRRARYSRA